MKCRRYIWLSLLGLSLIGLYGCISPYSDSYYPPDPCAGETGYFHRVYEWWGDYWNKWRLECDIPRYLYCRSRRADVPRSGDFPWYGLAKLVKWPEDDTFIYQLVREINSPYTDYYKRATNTLHFVQALMPYRPDVGEYWQSPVETLVRQEGDCEDGTILFIALLHSLEFPVCFGTYWDPSRNAGHAFGLVQVSQDWVEAHTVPWNKCYWLYCWTILREKERRHTLGYGRDDNRPHFGAN